MTKKLLVFMMLLITSLGFSQRPNQDLVKISGKVVDADTKTPLEYATITLLNKRNPDKITGGITDANGNFEIETTGGTYTIKIEYISFTPITLTDQTIRSATNLGTISLKIDAQQLDEVELIAEKTTVEIRLDKKIYNVGKDLTVRGGNVSDVLDNVPSVTVDVEGNVALRGNDDVRILINGKPSGLVGLNSTDALRQLPAEAIEKVEVITSPSARYDAEGTAGIINIILRRSKLQGLNGAITANVGYPESYGLSGNINYRTGDFNFFTTSGYNQRKTLGNSLNDTRFFDRGDGESFLREQRTFDRIRKGFNGNFGTEWYINDKTSLTASIVLRDSDNESNSTNLLRQTDALGNIINSERFSPEKEDDKTVQYSMLFDKKFKTDGHELSMEFQYETSYETEDTPISLDGIDSERVIQNEKQDRILLQLDYVLPLNEKQQLEFGYRGNFIDLLTDYDVDFFNENSGFDPTTDNELLDNELNYREYVNAFYSQYGQKIEKFSYLLGLRVEDSRITIQQFASSDFDRKTYTSLFPTVNLSYEFSEKQSLTLGYNRRIRRPRSRFINPFPSRTSATNLFQGNPDIDPVFTDAVDFGYLNRLGKITLNSSIFYQRSTGVFQFITEDTGETILLNGEETPVLRRTPVNLSSSDRYGFEFNVTYNPSRKWRMNTNFNVFQVITDGSFNNIDFSAENLSWFVRLNNKYTLPGKIDWQTNIFYRGPRETAQSKSQGIVTTSMAFSKDVFKEKGSIAFNVSDLFNSRKRISESFTPISFTESEFQWRERTFNLAFTYRFNQKKKRERNGRQDGGGDEEFEG
ncbi:TonB-dependent receptor domain-containing protein [Spongiivirga citrea]|uniref:TonB-dependent receptor n=1 Tax=Spongiivirga citrea TaxID=1481457 RepID=A0A6M0CFR3_9FLAO|nr:TonB-dependent receptor [Spongiivirga citrea]NER16665.1 TonB-dependent receptor [Spongiivirga citrea]